MENLEEQMQEIIHLRGSSGKPIKMTLGELAKKKICSKVEVENDKYYARITRWYKLDKTFNTLSEATSALVKITQKLDKIKRK